MKNEPFSFPKTKDSNCLASKLLCPFLFFLSCSYNLLLSMSIAWCILSVSMPAHITLDMLGKKWKSLKIDYSSQNKPGQKVKKHVENKKTQTKVRRKLPCRLTHLTRLKQEMWFPNKTPYSKIQNILCIKASLSRNNLPFLSMTGPCENTEFSNRPDILTLCMM